MHRVASVLYSCALETHAVFEYSSASCGKLIFSYSPMLTLSFGGCARVFNIEDGPIYDFSYISINATDEHNGALIPRYNVTRNF